jgi:hypothetical protein
MEAVTLVMPRQQARQAFVEYRKAVTINRTTEDEALMRAYREIARGNPVLDLISTMKMIGLGADFYPKFAITRADQPYCFVEMSRSGAANFYESSTYRSRRSSSLVTKVPDGTFPVWSSRWESERYVLVGRPQGWSQNATAIAPTVPPALRPKATLEHFHILWEAVWQPHTAPRDPMLLKHLGGVFYAVVAVWDLTELERAALRLR